MKFLTMAFTNKRFCDKMVYKKEGSAEYDKYMA